METVVLVRSALLHEVQVEDFRVVGDAGAGGPEEWAEVVVGGWGVYLGGVSWMKGEICRGRGIEG